MTNDTPREVKLAMTGVDVSNVLIAFLVNEGLIDQNRLSDWFNRVVDDRSTEEQNNPGSLVLRHMAQSLAQKKPGTGLPDWFQGIIDGGKPPDDEC